MSPERLVAECQHQGAIDHLVHLFDADELELEAIMAAIGACNATLAKCIAIGEIDRARACSQFTVLLDRVLFSLGGVR